MASNEPIYRHWSAQYLIDSHCRAYKWRVKKIDGLFYITKDASGSREEFVMLESRVMWRMEMEEGGQEKTGNKTVLYLYRYLLYF